MYGDGRKLLVSGAYSTMEVALRVIYNNFIPHSVKQKGLFLSNDEFAYAMYYNTISTHCELKLPLTANSYSSLSHTLTLSLSLVAMKKLNYKVVQ